MKVVARFPVKSSSVLSGGLILFHLFLISVIFSQVTFGVMAFLAIILTVISCCLCFRQYYKITQASDDLCWDSERWGMTTDKQLKLLVFLELQPESWVSGCMSLLYFTADDDKHVWLFTRGNLGSRAYSELTYLVNQDLSAQMNTDKKSI